MNENKSTASKAIAYIVKFVLLYFALYLLLGAFIGDGDTANAVKLATFIVLAWALYRHDFKVLK
jgi:hypothetical protein